MIASANLQSPISSLQSLNITRAEMERAFYNKDASYDGVFFVAVRTTGIFCLPSCSASPKRENVEFFLSAREAIFAGYRPCKRCHPLDVNGAPPRWAKTLMERVEKNPDEKITAREMANIGVTPERARRWFLDHYGMTFAEWQRGKRLAEAFTQIRNGSPLDDVVFANGYESHSGFRDAFSKTFGAAPMRARHTVAANDGYIAAQFIESPLGPILAAATRDAICFLEFSDRRMLEYNYNQIRKRFGLPILPTTNDALEQLRAELNCYFQGKQKNFTTRLAMNGTPFQERVWNELQEIPHGETISYEQLAQRIQQPTAVRAVARANGSNRISIIVPCHRVIGKDGELTGYGGGLWRKRLLLELERTGHLPGDN
ncbi:MAG: methylated-DNA--[protein]-cysteine S-methyltransferase [Chloroflexota bacterium]|nr:MAG: methylated-DNA--[protein]-cysteine S-methyltransferase [Chloroflexota bacterium]